MIWYETQAQKSSLLCVKWEHFILRHNSVRLCVKMHVHLLSVIVQIKNSAILPLHFSKFFIFYFTNVVIKSRNLDYNFMLTKPLLWKVLQFCLLLLDAWFKNNQAKEKCHWAWSRPYIRRNTRTYVSGTDGRSLCMTLLYINVWFSETKSEGFTET